MLNAKGSLCCFFCFDLSESSPRSLGSGKCSSHPTASKLLLKKRWATTDNIVVCQFHCQQLDSNTLKIKETCIHGFINLLLPLCVVFHYHLHRNKHRFHKMLALIKLCYCIVWTREVSTVYLFILALDLWLSMHF